MAALSGEVVVGEGEGVDAGVALRRQQQENHMLSRAPELPLGCRNQGNQFFALEAP